MLLDSVVDNDAAEGNVVKGRVVAIEKDLAIIDVGLKTEGRVPLKEFGQAGRDGTITVGSEVEVYVDRVENAAGEADFAGILADIERRDERDMGRADSPLKPAARKAGSASKRSSPRASASKASSSTRSRAASRSISTAPWRSCRAARSTSVRSAT